MRLLGEGRRAELGWSRLTGQDMLLGARRVKIEGQKRQKAGILKETCLL